MATIRYIKDKDDVIILPVTHERGVTDSAGVNLETKLMGFDDINRTSIPIPSGGDVVYHYVNSSGNWTGNGYHRSLLISVRPGERYLVTSKNDYDAVYTFLTSRSTSQTTGAAAIVEGTNANYTIAKGKTAEVVIPDGCVSLAFRGCTSQAQYNISLTLLCPQSVVRFEHLLDVVDRLQERTALPEIYAVGDVVNLNNLAYSNRLYGIIADRSYKLHILTPDAPISNVTGGSSTPTLTVYFADDNATVLSSETLSSAATRFRESYTVTAPSRATVMYFGVRCDVGNRFALTAELLDEDFGGSVLALNPESEFIPKMMAARKRYYTSSDNDRKLALTFLHLSDIHGNWSNVARYIRFADHYSGYLDGLINTGDIVTDYFTDGASGYAALDGVDKVMNVIGNHDTRGANGWQQYKGVDAYNTFIAPFVSTWEVTQPANAATNGYCYYYKDYTAKSVRLIVVDIMAYDDTEDTWLRGVLDTAKAAELHVVIATHYSGARRSSEAESERVFDKVACNYTTLYGFGGASVTLTNYNTSAYKMTLAVKDFLDGGGGFVGYIQGHYHADFIAKANEDSRQLIYSIGSSKSGEVRDYNHIVGTRMQDEFQIVAIDTNNTIVKLFKVGANIDRYGRTKGSVCVNYSTGELIGEGYF